MLHYQGNTLGNHEGETRPERQVMQQYLIVNNSTVENCDLIVTAPNIERARGLYFAYCAGQQWEGKRGDELRFLLVPDKAQEAVAHDWVHVL